MITVFSTTQGNGHGAEAVLCEMLAAWPADGLALRIAAPQGSRVLTCAGECGFERLPLVAGRDALMANARAIRKALHAVNDTCLVHAWSARSLEFAWWLKRRLGVPASGTLHDHPLASFHGRIRQRMIKMSANRMNALAVVSGAVSSAVKAAAWSVPISVIRNGLSDRLSPMLVKNGVPELSIGFLGMYAPWKGGALVADWIGHQGVAEGVVWKLYGAPSPSVHEQFKPLISRWPDRVRIEGRQDVQEIFCQIDILVHASTQFDPLPTVLIEAARAGIPCVASRLGGAPEIVENGVTGFLFDPAQPGRGLDALKRLVAEPPLRRNMGAAARRRYETHFHVGRMVADYQAFWTRLLIESEG